MAEKLPILISIPHGGGDVPVELMEKTPLNSRDIFYDGDPLTRQIYNLRGRVHTVIDVSIARAFIDLNRAPDDLPPENPDGVVKSQTVNGKLIYKDGDPLSTSEISLLLKNYYYPLHEKLARAARKNGLYIALDCHSMLARAPRNSPVPGALRPHFCVSNCGGVDGEPDKNYPDISCDPGLVRKMALNLQRAFGLKASDVKINDPFHGGYITTFHGLRPIPWMQIELNRELYLKPPWFDPEALAVAPLRIAWLQKRFYEALKYFCEDR